MPGGALITMTPEDIREVFMIPKQSSISKIEIDVLQSKIEGEFKPVTYDYKQFYEQFLHYVADAVGLSRLTSQNKLIEEIKILKSNQSKPVPWMPPAAMPVNQDFSELFKQSEISLMDFKNKLCDAAGMGHFATLEGVIDMMGRYKKWNNENSTARRKAEAELAVSETERKELAAERDKLNDQLERTNLSLVKALGQRDILTDKLDAMEKQRDRTVNSIKAAINRYDTNNIGLYDFMQMLKGFFK